MYYLLKSLTLPLPDRYWCLDTPLTLRVLLWDKQPGDQSPLFGPIVFVPVNNPLYWYCMQIVRGELKGMLVCKASGLITNRAHRTFALSKKQSTASSTTTMQTRNQFLHGLIPVTDLPEDIAECAICFDDLNNAVEVCPKHFFCQDCMTKWLTSKKCNTCPTCRRVLFDANAIERWRPDDNRVGILSVAMQNSQLLALDFADYGFDASRISLIHMHAAEACRYLSEDAHRPITTGKALINKDTGRHVLVMAKLLQGYAKATDRGYSGFQRRDWRLITEHLWKFVSHMDGQVFEGDNLARMAQDFRLAIAMSLRKDGVDTHLGRFFLNNAPLESAPGDLDTLLRYFVFQCTQAYEKRETVRAARRTAQREALERQTSRVGYALRFTGQRLFGMI